MKIKSYILIILLSGGLISCHNQSNQIPASVVNVPQSATGTSKGDNLPQMTFTSTLHDFGKVIQGEVVSYAFKFKNTGNADLIIANISTSCGCTATDYPKDPIPPGSEDFIKVRFDSAGKRGFQNKTVTIAANTQPSTTLLYIKALVVLPEEE